LSLGKDLGQSELFILHEKYGEVVRLAPSELSFSSAAAWGDIYQQSKSHNVFTKDPKFYITNNTNRAHQLVNIVDPEEHAQAKKVIVSFAAHSSELADGSVSYLLPKSFP
jgi:hypothetical protein